MDDNESGLIQKVASVMSNEHVLRWTMHNCWPARVSMDGGQMLVRWRDDIEENQMTIKRGSLQSNVVVQSNSHRTVFRFRHAAEGEVVLSCIHRDPVNKGKM